MKHTKEEHAKAIDALEKWYPIGSTVHTVIRSVSRSGMQAQISVLKIDKDCAWHPNWAVSVATGLTLKRGGFRDAVAVNGCGFDRAASIVEAIESALGYPAGSLKHVDL